MDLCDVLRGAPPADADGVNRVAPRSCHLTAKAASYHAVGMGVAYYGTPGCKPSNWRDEGPYGESYFFDTHQSRGQ